MLITRRIAFAELILIGQIDVLQSQKIVDFKIFNVSSMEKI